jgi:hypothetical protein
MICSHFLDADRVISRTITGLFFMKIVSAILSLCFFVPLLSVSHPARAAVFQAAASPQPHVLSAGPYWFSDWDAESPAGTYPPNMVFLQTPLSDPGLEVEMDSAWTMPYNLTNRSRINGLGTDGFAFINTTNPQDVEGAGYLGAAVLALNTLGEGQIRVTWTGGTVLSNSRVYGIRLQYRVGTEGTFANVLNAQGDPVEYIRNSDAGHARVIGPVNLPASLANQPHVELRWKYHYISGDSGARAQLRISDILVTSGTAVAAKLAITEAPSAAQTGQALFPVRVEAQSQQGERITAFNGMITVAKVSGPGTLTGTWVRQAVNGRAVFDDLELDAFGVHTLRASAAGLETAQTGEIHVVELTEQVMPQFLQGQQPENENRVPFAFRIALNGLLPGATYRYGNRIITEEDPAAQNGAGNMILVKTDGSDFVRTTETPRFREDDLDERHGQFTTDEAGSFAGWFVTEPSGNPRFTPGNTVFVRLLLNDGQGGEDYHHFLTAPSPMTVLEFGSEATDATAVYGVSSSAPRDFILLHEDPGGLGRPLVATFVERSGAQVDERYAAFYKTFVSGNNGRWGNLLPNFMEEGVRRVETRSLLGGEVIHVFTAPQGIHPTANLSGGTAPVALYIPGDETGYHRWAPAFFSLEELADENISGLLADPDGDLLPNLLEYALGLNPRQPGHDRLPTAAVEEIDGVVYLSFHHRRLIGETDLAYVIEVSQDLETWDDSEGQLLFLNEVPTGDGLTEIVTALLPIDAATQGFLRLRISRID